MQLNPFARGTPIARDAWLHKPSINYLESSRFEKSRTVSRLAWDSLIVRQTRAVRRNIVNSRSTQYSQRLHLHTYTSRRHCKLHALTLRYRKLTRTARRYLGLRPVSEYTTPIWTTGPYQLVVNAERYQLNVSVSRPIARRPDTCRTTLARVRGPRS